MLSQLRDTATRTGPSTSAGGALADSAAATARRSFSLRKNLSQHLDLGTSAVPASARLPAAALKGRAASEEDVTTPSGTAPSEATDEDQVFCEVKFVSIREVFRGATQEVVLLRRRNTCAEM